MYVRTNINKIPSKMNVNANVLTYTTLYAAFRVGDLFCVQLVPSVAVNDG
jgi:hypothetical protein